MGKKKKKIIFYFLIKPQFYDIKMLDLELYLLNYILSWK